MIARACAVMVALMLLSSCGYHLVGHGEGTGAIPADVHTVTITGNADARLLSMLRQRLVSQRYQLIDGGAIADTAHHALLHVQLNPLAFVPSAYDLSGVATQYRMTFTGSLMLEQDGKTLWQSGPIQRQGDVYVSGGPASIDASRTRLLSDLQKQWVSDAVGR
ncbi:MAG: adenosylmethionine-8-amino-7-oxononanoate aminotransferase, partial [Zetaproteobacteria bacterium CG23_combo_of_CG06-09_8_20_14_all_54_7]